MLPYSMTSFSEAIVLNGGGTCSVCKLKIVKIVCLLRENLAIKNNRPNYVNLSNEQWQSFTIALMMS